MRLALTPTQIITVACLIALVTFGARSGFGLFLAPITATYGWGREIFAVAIGIQNLMWGLGQPVAGALADRFGIRPVLIWGALIYAGGLVLMGLSSSPTGLYVSAGFLVGAGGAGASFGLVLAAVGRMVPEERRSAALGLVVAASSMGQFLLVPLRPSLHLGLRLVGGAVHAGVPRRARRADEPAVRQGGGRCDERRRADPDPAPCATRRRTAPTGS